MSASSEYEPAARQDYGPTTSSENVYEHVLDHKLADMSVPMRTPVLRAVPVSLSPPEGDPEPDSTDPENIAHSSHTSLDKEVEYPISEKNCDTEIPVESLTSIVRIEDTTLDNVSHIAYPIIQEADDSSDANYVENSSAALIQAPLNTTIVQNVTKLPQNFTINVDTTVSNITTLQNVSQDITGASQTLWLPTLVATTPTDGKPEDEGSQTGVSQFIITSESYVTSETSGGQAGPRRANILTETAYISRPKASKVQILSNVAIPKNPTYSQQYSQASKEVAQVYGTQNHVYKLNTNVISQKQFNNSVLTNKPPKNQSLIGSGMSPAVNSPVKNLSYSHTLTKGTNLNKSLNKVNNGANLNTVVATSSGTTQCHILSRVVSGPNKLSVHSGRKSVNTFKGAKNSALSGGQKQSRAIKIIQQTGSTHKSDGKSWPVTNMATYKSQQPSYGIIDTNNSKIIQKVGSPAHKSQATMSLPKAASKGERLVLQSPCGPVLISTAPISTSLHKGPHYVQSGPAPNLRYVHTYGPESNQLSNVSQVSANQQLTAQILQSLSQPKLLMPAAPKIINHSFPPVPPSDDYMDIKPANQRRIVFGDPSTLLTADDIIGMEERPNLTEELRRYSFHSLALVMLDHTYSQPAQKQPAASSPPTVPPPAPVAPPSPARLSEPQSPVKQTSPVVTTTNTYEPQHLQPLSVPSSAVGTLIPVSSFGQTLQLGSLYKPTVQDDDAGSVISSLEGERRDGDRAGSDTETAPEVEEEGKTRCCCEFTHDDGYMICCDRCGEWQHVDCMGIDRNNIPDAYMCELCQPRPVDRRHARAIQLRKREELSAIGVASDSDSSGGGRLPGQRRKRLLTVTTYTDTSGSCVTTYNSNVPALAPLPAPSLPLPKRGPKRPKKPDAVRKGAKRKLSEKRVKRKKEMMLNRSKYNASVSNSSHWQDSYESAMTNHYSPELRAKIVKYSSKLGSAGSVAAAITAHLCTTVPHAGGKILIATRDLRESTPVIELRGKYMLSTQHRPQPQHAPRAGSQKPGPFVFFYRLPKDNTQVCIDTRTYGNEARFVRRSCKPNAELQHCIVKGALHVYLVTIGPVPSNTEITVGHDAAGGKQPCACGNPKHCRVNGLNPMLSRRSVDYPPREKRSRNRTTSLAETPMSPPAPVTPVKDAYPLIQHIKSEKKSPIKQEMSPISPVKHTVPPLNFDRPIKSEPEVKEEQPQIELLAREEMKPELDEPDCADPPEPPPRDEPPPPPPPPLEPVKTEVIERPLSPPAEEQPQEIIKPEEEKVEPIEPEQKIIKTDTDLIFSDEEKTEKPEKLPSKDELKEEEEEKPVTREISAKSACHDRSARTSRTACVNQDSLDDKTDDSQDKLLTNTKEKDKKKMTREERKMEAIMKAFERMEKAEQRKQEVKERQKRRESDPHPHAADRDEDEDSHACTKRRRKRKGRARTTSQSNRRRLNSADSDMVTSGDEAPAMMSPRPPVRRVSAPNHHPTLPAPSADLERGGDRIDPVTEDLGLSSACLLVEAAVGCVESAFKLPKTKKTMATEWVGRSPEPDRTPSPYREPYRPALVPATSLESLVRVASTMIGDLGGGHSEPEEMISPPRTPARDRSRPPKKSKRITRSTPLEPPPETPPPAAPPQHSAKKRWLRQAISEESEEPNAESPPSEMVTPLKKRRLARESLSCEQSAAPCTEAASPRLTSDESPVKDDRHRTGSDTVYLRDQTRTRSDSGQGSDDHEPCHMEHVLLNLNLRGPHASENIRRIIGVPEEPPAPAPAKPEERAGNNNVGETEPAPMEVDADPLDKVAGSRSHSADTSGNSSPLPDEMDDIQKKIHSFHTENILMLKSRNKKPPKEKRKKVNLNFDLSMVDDQISVQLRTEAEPTLENGDVHEEAKIHYVTTENIPLPPVETIPLPATEHIPLPDEPLPGAASPPEEPAPPPAPPQPSPLDGPQVPFSSRFNSTGLFSGIFSNMTQTYTADLHVNENVPGLSVMKSALGLESLPPGDELRSVHEILTRVNSMDSNSSVLLSGVLKSSEPASKPVPALLSPGPKPYGGTRADPRLNPPPSDKPKPVRRKLSISEYRKRHLGCAGGDPGELGPASANSSSCEAGGGGVGEWSSESSNAGSLSPLRLEAAAAAAADDLEQRLHRALATPTAQPTPTNTAHHNVKGKGVFDAQPTASERQRENLSSRLRREFGLALPDDETARPAPPPPPGDVPPPPPPAPGTDTMHFGILGQIAAAAAAAPPAPGPPPLRTRDAPVKWGRRGA